MDHEFSLCLHFALGMFSHEILPPKKYLKALEEATVSKLPNAVLTVHLGLMDMVMLYGAMIKDIT